MNHCPSPANTGATPVAIAGLQNLALLDNSKDAPLAADIDLVGVQDVAQDWALAA